MKLVFYEIVLLAFLSLWWLFCAVFRKSGKRVQDNYFLGKFMYYVDVLHKFARYSKEKEKVLKVKLS